MVAVVLHGKAIDEEKSETFRVTRLPSQAALCRFLGLSAKSFNFYYSLVNPFDPLFGS